MKQLQAAHDWLFTTRRKLATIAVGLLALYVGSYVMFGANGMIAYHKKRAEHRRLQQEIESLQNESERLNKNIEAFKTDPKAIEKEAREQLRYARPGEVIYTAPPRQMVPANASAQKR